MAYAYVGLQEKNHLGPFQIGQLKILCTFQQRMQESVYGT